jgi:hypothetical protein
MIWRTLIGGVFLRQYIGNLPARNAMASRLTTRRRRYQSAFAVFTTSSLSNEPSSGQRRRALGIGIQPHPTDTGRTSAATPRTCRAASPASVCYRGIELGCIDRLGSDRRISAIQRF